MEGQSYVDFYGDNNELALMPSDFVRNADLTANEILNFLYAWYGYFITHSKAESVLLDFQCPIVPELILQATEVFFAEIQKIDSSTIKHVYIFNKNYS